MYVKEERRRKAQITARLLNRRQQRRGVLFFVRRKIGANAAFVIECFLAHADIARLRCVSRSDSKLGASIQIQSALAFPLARRVPIGAAVAVPGPAAPPAIAAGLPAPALALAPALPIVAPLPVPAPLPIAAGLAAPAPLPIAAAPAIPAAAGPGPGPVNRTTPAEFIQCRRMLLTVPIAAGIKTEIQVRMRALDIRGFARFHGLTLDSKRQM